MRCLLTVFLVSLAFNGMCQDSLLLKSIYFGGGSYYVDEFQVNELYQFIDAVEQLENYEIIIFSHTDNIGGLEYNQWLSKMRSDAVVDQLLLKGISEELIEIRDFGLTNPLYTNYSGAGRRGNRRVDVILWPIVF